MATLLVTAASTACTCGMGFHMQQIMAFLLKCDVDICFSVASDAYIQKKVASHEIMQFICVAASHEVMQCMCEMASHQIMAMACMQKLPKWGTSTHVGMCKDPSHTVAGFDR